VAKADPTTAKADLKTTRSARDSAPRNSAQRLAYVAVAISLVSLIVAVLGFFWSPLRGADSARFVALGIAQLRPALVGHGPFRDELILLRRVMPSEPDLGEAFETLSAYADRGVPTLRELQGRFPRLASGMVLSGMLGNNGGGFDRAVIATGAALRLHSVAQWVYDPRPVSDIAAEARVRLDAGDLRGALAALANLPEREATIAAGWIADAQSRMAADRVLDRLEVVAGSLMADPARRSLVSN
jgi:hypothetical protein